jgi:chemotaxis signal transduction protein
MSGGQVLLFRAGGQRLGVFLAEVGRLLVEGELTPVPFSHPAMAGVLDTKEDGPVPVFDLFGLIEEEGAPPRHARGATVALFPTKSGPVGLRLEALLATISDYTALDGDEGKQLLADVPPALRPTLTQTARGLDGTFAFFSPEAFLARLGL